MSETDYSFATVAQLVAAMDARRVTSLELTEGAIRRIEKYDVVLNAVPVRDFARAIETARSADALRAAGTRLPLLGVPVTVKESFNVAGLPTTWGIPPFKDFIAEADALPVTRLREAGAVILGKTNVPVALGDLQTYNPIYGVTNNPWDTTVTPGGSSGGSAAALAAGFGALSIGSDIAGSLRVPAHFCGVFAHKPSFGLVPSRGHNPPAIPALEYGRDLTVTGPMARTAADLELVLDLLAVADAPASNAYTVRVGPARHEDLGAYRILIVEQDPAIATSAAVREAFEDVSDALTKAGAAVSWASSLLPDMEEAGRIYMQLLLGAIAATYPPELYEDAKTAAAGVPVNDKSLAAARVRGAVLSYRDWLSIDTARTVLRKQWAALFDEFDAVICPAAPTPAFAHDHSPVQWERKLEVDGQEYDYADQLVWAGVASAPGLPATVLPVKRSTGGLPVGLQIVGPMNEDRTTLRLAALLEKELGGFVAPPLY